METADRRLPALAFGARRQISLWFLGWIYWRCSLDIRNSWFMGCWGSKQFLRHYSASVNLFKITRRNPSAPYFLKVRLHSLKQELDKNIRCFQKVTFFVLLMYESEVLKCYGLRKSVLNVVM